MVSRFGLPEGSVHLTPHKRGVSLERIGDQTDAHRLLPNSHYFWRGTNVSP